MYRQVRHTVFLPFLFPPSLPLPPSYYYELEPETGQNIDKATPAVTDTVRKYDRMSTGTLAVTDVVSALRDLGISLEPQKMKSELDGMERIQGDSSRVSVNVLQVCLALYIYIYLSIYLSMYQNVCQMPCRSVCTRSCSALVHLAVPRP